MDIFRHSLNTGIKDGIDCKQHDKERVQWTVGSHQFTVGNKIPRLVICTPVGVKVLSVMD